MTFYLFKGSVTLYTGLGDDDVTVKQGQVFGEDAMLVSSGNLQVTAVTKEHTTAVVRPLASHYHLSPLATLRSGCGSGRVAAEVLDGRTPCTQLNELTRPCDAHGGGIARRCCTRSTWRQRCTWASASGKCICRTTHASR
jgi:hypothetical protein